MIARRLALLAALALALSVGACDKCGNFSLGLKSCGEAGPKR